MDAPEDQGPPFPPDPLIGKVVSGRYRIVDVLGEGGIAVVYRAEHLGLGRMVALKVLHPMYGEHEELRARFEREAQALAALSHPHIVNLLDYGVEEDMPYLVMELLEGRTLRDLLDEHGTLPPERAFAVLRQVLRGLSFAHGQGLVHRDLKPGNVFLQALPDTADHVKILDFGFAKFVAGEQRDEGPALTRAGKVFGTPAYMSPEQVTGGGIDGRADLYAVGVLLYEMLAGRKPFEGEVPEMIRAKVLGTPMRLAEARPEIQIHPALDRLLEQALARKDDRYQDANTMLAALDAVPQPAIAPAEQRPSEPAVAPGTGTAGPSTRPLLIAAMVAVPALAVLVLCAAGGIFFALRGGPEEEPETVPVSVTSGPEAEPEDIPVAVDGLAVADPWGEDTLPPLLSDARDHVERGEDVDQDVITALRQHARVERDARAWLLIAHIYALRGWRSDAIDTYQAAHRVDPAVRGDPRMLANLVAMSAHAGVADEAALAVRRIYGAEALPTVEAALRSPHLRPDGVQRLDRLRRSLES